MTTKGWTYTKQWENPEEKIAAIDKEYGRITSSPVFFGYWAKVSPYRVVLKDYEEGLHSLIQENTCSCGLRLNKSDSLLAIIESKHHRNHKTLEPELNPEFRGPVGRRISMPLQPANWQHPVDVLWDQCVNAKYDASSKVDLASKLVANKQDLTGRGSLPASQIKKLNNQLEIIRKERSRVALSKQFLCSNAMSSNRCGVQTA